MRLVAPMPSNSTNVVCAEGPRSRRC